MRKVSMIVCETIERMIGRREEIARLLEEKDLRVTYCEHFCRWQFGVYDREGKRIWHTRDVSLKKIQRELYEFLKNYKKDEKDDT
jgi:hypothetical protein